MEQNITNILPASNNVYFPKKDLQDKYKNSNVTSKKTEKDSFIKTNQVVSNKNNSKTIWGVILATAGVVIAAIIAVKMHKKVKIKSAIPKTSPVDYEKEKQAAIEIARKNADNQYAGMREQLDEQLRTANEQVKKAQESTIAARKQAKEARKKSEEFAKYADETIAKDKENFERAQKEFDEFKERMEKEAEDFRKRYEKFKEDSQKSFDDYWEQTRKFYEEFYSKNSKNLSKNKLIFNAKEGIKIFKQYGRDNNGNVYEEIAKMDSVENLTPEIVKKAHHRLVKKYFPLINTGTEKEKEEATRIMQKLNPASDAMRLYLGIK